MEVVKRAPVWVYVEGRTRPVRVADTLVLKEDCVYYYGVEVKTEKYGTVFIPYPQIKGDIKHLLDEVKLEKEYN